MSPPPSEAKHRSLVQIIYDENRVSETQARTKLLGPLLCLSMMQLFLQGSVYYCFHADLLQRWGAKTSFRAGVEGFFPPFLSFHLLLPQQNVTWNCEASQF